MKGKFLDNTLLIVMGDHGARYSKVRQTVQVRKHMLRRGGMILCNVNSTAGARRCVKSTLREVLDVRAGELLVGSSATFYFACHSRHPHLCTGVFV